MPESRTFDPSSDDPIQQALLKALGQPVRPRQPGSPDAAPKPAAPKPPTVTTIGSFTFGAQPAPPPKRPGEDADAELD